MNDEVPCKDHPDAPHGFCRDASHSYDRYVCECEFWEPEENKIYTQAELNAAVLAEREACASLRKEISLVGLVNDEYESGFWDALELYEKAIRARGEQ